MEYFSLSPFWDSTCNNAALAMQKKFAPPDDKQPASAPGPPDEQELLRWAAADFYVEHRGILGKWWA